MKILLLVLFLLANTIHDANAQITFSIKATVADQAGQPISGATILIWRGRKKKL